MFPLQFKLCKEHIICDNQNNKSEIQNFYNQILAAVQSEVIFFWAISNIFINIKAPCVQNIS